MKKYLKFPDPFLLRSGGNSTRHSNVVVKAAVDSESCAQLYNVLNIQQCYLLVVHVATAAYRRGECGFQATNHIDHRGS